MKKIVDPDKAYQWILDNKDKLTLEELREALNRWCAMEGYTELNGEDIMWIWKNVFEDKRNKLK